jgi:hypothetical protein
MSTAVLFVTTKESRNNSNVLSVNEGIYTTWYAHAGEYYSPIKKNEVMICATREMSIEGMVVTESSQVIPCDSIYIKCPHRQIHRGREQIRGFQVLAEKVCRVTVSSYNISLWNSWKCFRISGGVQYSQCTKIHWILNLKMLSFMLYELKLHCKQLKNNASYYLSINFSSLS